MVDLTSLSHDAAGSMRHPLTRALLALTFTTGLIDGVSYLGLGHVFTANMTGNIVLLGFGIAGGTGLPVVAPIISLLAFLIGSVLGGKLAGRYAADHVRHIRLALGIELVMLALTAIVAAAHPPRIGSAAAYLVIAMLAFAMGVRNATIRKLAVPDLTTTVLTMTLTGLAADTRLNASSVPSVRRRVAAVLAMLVGALVGALTLKQGMALPLALAAAIALVTWLLYIPAAQAFAAEAAD